MTKRLIYGTNLLIAALVLSISVAQAQTTPAHAGQSEGQTTSPSLWRFSSLRAQARAQAHPQPHDGLMRMATSRSGKTAFSPLASDSTLPVFGGGSVGRLTKWTQFASGRSFIGDTTIFEDNAGNVGIGTDSPSSQLTVAGMVQITLGGLMFADGTVQTTAGLSSLFHNASLTGNGTNSSPLGIAPGGVQTVHLAGGSVTAPKIANGTVVRSLNGLVESVTLQAGANITITPAGNTLTIAASDSLASIAHDATLQGNGTGGAPLGVAVPLFLNGDGGRNGVIQVTNTSDGGDGVAAFGGDSNSTNFGGDGVFAEGGSGSGPGHGGGFGIAARGGRGLNGAIEGLAGRFIGDVQVTGNLSKGGGSFKIDHPLDPENKYLHSFVESPDMMNIYNGNITTDQNGAAQVTLPDWFEALNRDFRYQLTVIGTFAQAIVADEVQNHRFKIKTNAPNVKVSWQVTGIRRDAYADKHRIPVEEAKPEAERGSYLHPDAYGQPEERGVEWARHPQVMQQLKQRRLQLSQH